MFHERQCGDFDGAVADPAEVERAFAVWRREIAFADGYAATADWSASVPDEWRGALSLRWVLLHMIEEYARHNGHADILRERIDGRVGQ